MTTDFIPMYVVSKGRAETQRTCSFLAEMGQPHFVVVEPDEVAAYEANLPWLSEVIALDMSYKETYDLLDDLGLSKSTGPGPARNFAWDHSTGLGAAYHWVMDDNIAGFFRLNRNLKTPAKTPRIFEAMAAFVRRYSNVVMAGPNYFRFANRRDRMPPFIWNTRIYSCNLIRNDATDRDGRPFRWRGRYNEDTILSLDMLTAGLCTVQFNAFLQDKMDTQAVSGGNTAEFYAGEGTAPKSEMLVRVYPEYAKISHRFSRVHHHVDYRPFRRNRPEFANGGPPEGVDNFGMRLQRRTDAGWRDVLAPDVISRYSTGAMSPDDVEVETEEDDE